MLWFYKLFFPVVWITFFIYWRIRASKTKTTQRLEPMSSRILRSFLCLVGVALLILPPTWLPLPWLYRQLWPIGLLSFWLGAALTIAGLLFAVSAREYLGSNWSSAVTIKQGHELITTGPYSMVRHPIYTGILIGFLGMAIAMSQVRAFIVLALFFIAFWIKLRREEQFMRSQFGEVYVTYARHTAALVPYLL
jgi:protein-S-isoprenylcysteine O-methyltransferase Ste14